MSSEKGQVRIPERPEVTAACRARTYSLHLSDATAVMTKDTVDGALVEMMTRLYADLSGRFGLPEIRAILAADPQRKMALRISFQLIDEGANESEIRQTMRADLQAFDEFIERERPKMLVKPAKRAERTQ